MMKRTIIILFLTCQLLSSYAQNPATEQITLDQGTVVLNVCKVDVPVSYKEDLEYYWYSEVSGYQKTKGSSSGRLLHGKMQVFWSNGKLRDESQYYLGLENGWHKAWNKEGQLVDMHQYKMGILVYGKEKTDEGNWVEYVGIMLQPKSVCNLYDATGKVKLKKTVWLNSVDVTVYIYHDFPDSGKVKMRYTENSVLHWCSDTFATYYINGKAKAIGVMNNDSKDGIWKYYNEDGKLRSTEKYRIHKEYYPTGRLMLSGGEFFNPETNTWIKDGRWITWEENGTYPKEDVKYALGEVVQELQNSFMERK